MITALFQVFDIFGPVVKPMYAILFNNIKEASEWRVGSAMYYAPSSSQFTHTIFTEKLRQQVFHYLKFKFDKNENIRVKILMFQL